MVEKIVTLDGKAIYGELKDIDKSETDLVQVNARLKTLIQDIKMGEYDCAYTPVKTPVFFPDSDKIPVGAYRIVWDETNKRNVLVKTDEG